MILDDYIMDSNIIMVIELFKNEILFFVCGWKKGINTWHAGENFRLNSWLFTS